MRRALWLLPLLLVGCKPGRQAAVSNGGRVASTAEGGTFVAGQGRIGESGSALAWSPDGDTLAVAAKGGVVFWPKGGRITGLEGPLAWTRSGDGLAGVGDGKVVVRDLATGTTRDPGLDLKGLPNGLRWTTDDRLVGWRHGRLQVEGAAALDRGEADIADAVGLPDGEVAWLEYDLSQAKTLDAGLAAPLRRVRWSPSGGVVPAASLGSVGGLLGSASPRRLVLPKAFALAPDGVRAAASGVVFEAGPRAIARLRALLGRSVTKAEQAELDRLQSSASVSAVVVRLDASGETTTLWREPLRLVGDERGVEDLAFSSDGRWLAIARREGTVRVAFGE